MNYLAHAYLNGKLGDKVLMGNMMGDFVKGKQYLDYEADIQQGIILHRAIDTFTDSHALVSKAKSFFRADYGLYSGILVDVVFDYYLANDKNIFPTQQALHQFVQHVYAVIKINNQLMNDKMKHLTHYMILHDWLTNYQNKIGIEKSWQGMSKRIARMNDVTKAIEIWYANDNSFLKIYNEFIICLNKEFLS